MADSYEHVKCGKRIKNSAYHCAACHDSFIGLTAFDGHRVGGQCEIVIAADPYTAKPTEFWIDAAGYVHRGRRMTQEEKDRVWGAKAEREEFDEEYFTRVGT